MDYLKRVRLEPCLVCQGARGGSDPHHLMIMGGRGTGLRADDRWAVPLCRLHHDELHSMGNEYKFWEKHMIDPVPWCEDFWSEHGEEL